MERMSLDLNSTHQTEQKGFILQAPGAASLIWQTYRVTDTGTIRALMTRFATFAADQRAPLSQMEFRSL
jgi:hypothetical protein